MDDVGGGPSDYENETSGGYTGDEAWDSLDNEETTVFNPDPNSTNWAGGERPGPTTVTPETKEWLEETTAKDKEIIESKIKETETALKDYDKPWYEKIARGVLNVVTYGLGGKVLDAANKLTKSDDDKLSDADKKIEQAKLEKQLLEYEDALNGAENLMDDLEERYPGKVDDVKQDITKDVKEFIARESRDPSPEEFKTIINTKVATSDPDVVRKKAQEDLIKSYNPNANLSQFGMVDPKMLGADSNPALEAGLEQLRQMEAKRAEAQAIRDKSLAETDAWTQLNEGNRDAWAKYYNPSDYRASATESGMTTVTPASTISGDYNADLSTLKGTQTDVKLTNADTWRDYFKGVEGYQTDASTAGKTTVAKASEVSGDYKGDLSDLRFTDVGVDVKNTDAWRDYFSGIEGYKTDASTAGKTTVAPTSQLMGDYRASGDELRGFDPTTMTSEQRADAVNAMNMSKDRAEGKKPSVAELSYMQNLDKLISGQQGAAAAQRGAGSPLAMRSITQQASQIGQQAVRETAELRAKEQQESELAYANQANQIMLADQQRVTQEKQMQLEQKVQQTQVELQNAKNTLDKDMFNIDAMNKVSQLQAQLDASLQEFNANTKNQINLQNTANKLTASQYAGEQEKSKVLSQLQADTTTKANELQKSIQYTQGLLQNAQVELEKDQFNVDARNKVNQLQAQLDASLQEFNANAKNQVNMQNTQNQMSMTQYAGAQEQAKMVNQLQADSTSRANELQKNIQYTQGLLQNAQTALEKDQFNADAINKVNTLQAQLEAQTKNLNAELQTRTALANAQSNLQGAMWAGQQAQGALNTQLSQERADTLTKYGMSRDALGTEMDILNSLSNQEIALGSAQKGWDYNQQQLERQQDMDTWTKLGITAKAGGDLLGTLSEFI